MDTVTHALMPVILAHLSIPRAKRFDRWGLVAIGIAGALPDLLNPHISLQARMSSWSHGLPFWAILSVVLIAVSFLSKQRFSLRLSGCLACAYLLHLFCDSISGGLNWLYPITNFVWGDYWVKPILWIPLDILCLLWCYYLFRLRPLLDKRKNLQQRSTQHELHSSP